LFANLFNFNRRLNDKLIYYDQIKNNFSATNEIKMTNNKNKKTNFVLLFIFALAMGFLEAIVVVYIRELYYPAGFGFPLKPLPAWLIAIEITREFCTLIMLGTVAWIAGKTFLQRLSAFLFLFGVWDIFYYVALKIFLNWPESFFTWDILFLIPITWIGPVLAPIICSVFMIIMAFVFEFFNEKIYNLKIKWIELLFMICGSIFIYLTFSFDFGLMIFKGNYLKNFLTLPQNPGFISEMTRFIPINFKWELFGFGILLIVFGNLLFLKRSLKILNMKPH